MRCHKHRFLLLTHPTAPRGIQFQTLDVKKTLCFPNYEIIQSSIWNVRGSARILPKAEQARSEIYSRNVTWNWPQAQWSDQYFQQLLILTVTGTVQELHSKKKKPCRILLNNWRLGTFKKKCGSGIIQVSWGSVTLTEDVIYTFFLSCVCDNAFSLAATVKKPA